MWIKEKDKGGLIRETEMLPERDNEEATEDKIKGGERERGLQGAGRRWRMSDGVCMEEK